MSTHQGDEGPYTNSERLQWIEDLINDDVPLEWALALVFPDEDPRACILPLASVQATFRSDALDLISVYGHPGRPVETGDLLWLPDCRDGEVLLATAPGQFTIVGQTSSGRFHHDHQGDGAEPLGIRAGELVRHIAYHRHGWICELFSADRVRPVV